MAANATTFRKGQSGNPKGRKPLSEAARAAIDARVEAQPTIVAKLLAIIESPKSEAKDVIAAARVLFIDREGTPIDVNVRNEAMREALRRDPEAIIALARRPTS